VEQLAEAVDQTELAALISRDGGADIMPGLLAVDQFAVKANMLAYMEVATEFIALLVEFVAAEIDRRCERRESAGPARKRRCSGDRKVAMVRIIVAEAGFPVQGQVNVARFRQRDELDRVEPVTAFRRWIAQIAVVLFETGDVGVAAAGAFSLVEPCLRC